MERLVNRQTDKSDSTAVTLTASDALGA
jgi:hypothetical protein